MGIEENGRSKDYVENVCSKVKNREMHEEIKLELESHIEELSEEFIAQGLSGSEAADKAIAQMGDSTAVGVQLNEIYKQRPEWGIFILTLIFAGVGLLSIYFIESRGVLNNNSSSMFDRTLVFNLFGAILAAGFYFFDYRRIRPFSKYIYIATLLILISTLFTGRRVNGLSYFIIGPISINFVEVSPVLFIISLAGIFDGWDWSNKRNILLALTMLAAPAFIMLAHPSFTAAIIYSVSFIVLMTVSGVSLKYVVSIVGSGVVMFLLLLFTGPSYRIQRFVTFINPEKDPSGGGWIYMQLKNAMHSAGLLGQGFTLKARVIPEVHTDFILTYIVYTFGWAAGVLLIALFLAFILRIAGIARMVRNNYGRMLTSGFAAIFSIEFLWNVLMTLGLAPLGGVGLPFISYGGSQFVLNMVAIGLILSIYSRKNAKKVTV